MATHLRHGEVASDDGTISVSEAFFLVHHDTPPADLKLPARLFRQHRRR